MGTGWRRVLCTAVRRDPHSQPKHEDNNGSPSPSPSPRRTCGKLSFFSSSSNASTAGHGTPKLRCRTKPTHDDTPHKAFSSRTPPPKCTISTNETAAAAPTPNKKRLQALFQLHLSAPSSPRSPSRFGSLFRPSLLLSRANGGGFNPIPEAEEGEGDNNGCDHDDVMEDQDFRGFFPHPAAPHSKARNGLEVSMMPEAALVSSGRRHGKYVVAIKVKAPAVRSSSSSRRAPIDLVTVLDVSQRMTGEKLQVLKRGMRLVIASLGPSDRLSIVAFSGAAKRLLPLCRMSRQGQRSARRIIDRLVVCAAAQGQEQCQSTCAGDALLKATKVLEDRRERNPVATIMLLSDTQQQQQQHHEMRKSQQQQRRTPPASARFAHVEIPIAATQTPKAPDAFAKCLGGLVSVVMQDVHLQLVFPSGEISAVYSCGPGQQALPLGASVQLGEMYAEEERQLLIELRAPLHSQHHHPHSLSVACSYRDPASQETVCESEQLLLLPQLRSGSSSQRIHDLFVASRAIAESRRLAELSDYATALHLLSSARTLLLQSQSSQQQQQQQDLICSLDTELSDIQWRRSRQQQQQHQQSLTPSSLRRRREVVPAATTAGSEEPLTPTSAWRAAEQLAKVAIMRKSMNRVSDLHGFENARF